MCLNWECHLWSLFMYLQRNELYCLNLITPQLKGKKKSKQEHTEVDRSEKGNKIKEKNQIWTLEDITILSIFLNIPCKDFNLIATSIGS